MQLIFTGDIDFEQLKAAVGNAFDGWEGGAIPQTRYLAQRKCQITKYLYRGQDSVAARFGFNTG